MYHQNFKSSYSSYCKAPIIDLQFVGSGTLSQPIFDSLMLDAINEAILLAETIFSLLRRSFKYLLSDNNVLIPMSWDQDCVFKW